MGFFFIKLFAFSLTKVAGWAFFGEIENAEENWREHVSLTRARASSSRFYLFITDNLKANI